MFLAEILLIMVFSTSVEIQVVIVIFVSRIFFAPSSPLNIIRLMLIVINVNAEKYKQ
jgi:hypothetical protein